jgi:hypothetical protein
MAMVKERLGRYHGSELMDHEGILLIKVADTEKEILGVVQHMQFMSNLK